MYGEMSRVRSRAAELRALATELRARASSLLAQSEAMQWSSQAAVVLRTSIGVMAHDLGRQAASLEAAALSLEGHARAVDAVKRAIEDAMAWVSDRWNDAATVVRNVQEVVEDVIESAVTGFMRVLAVVVGEDNVKRLTVSVFTLFGREISESQVNRSRQILGTVPSLPRAGSKEWLDVRSTFTRRGWG